MVSSYLPALIRMREWRLLFSIDRDGTSFQTFYQEVEDRDNTVMIIEDEDQCKFGCYMSEYWYNSKENFYGSGDGIFLFKICDQDVEIYEATFVNDRYQHSDNQSITVGSGLDGKSSIYITKNFLSGYSGPSETFTNPQLSSKRDFKIIKFEVWGFDHL